MEVSGKQLKWVGVSDLKMISVALMLVIPLLVLGIQAHAQTYTVIHNFTGGGDGARLFAGLTMDRAGSLYGTASFGGITRGPCADGGCGTVFKLKRLGSAWILTPLYRFQGGSDGAHPLARVTIGPDGSLYGATNAGGIGCELSGGCGTVFRLRPPARACSSAICPWTETVLYRFTGGSDGASPLYGDLTLDQVGNLYGTASEAGADGEGVVFKLAPSGGAWTESTLYSFSGGNDGAIPAAGLIFDNSGNLYGTTQYGGTVGNGTIYELSPSESGWTEAVISSLQSGGLRPLAGLISDASGNLYGTTFLGGSQGSGAVYELQRSDGRWTTTELYSFSGDGGPVASLTLDTAGNLYGTSNTTSGLGSVYKLIPSSGSWNYFGLHEFSGSDGSFPFGNIIFDGNGALYGTASIGGTSGSGVVWEITP